MNSPSANEMRLAAPPPFCVYDAFPNLGLASSQPRPRIMHAYLRALRTVAGAQALILVFLATIVAGRHQLGEDLTRAEAATLAASLMRLPAQNAHPMPTEAVEDHEKEINDEGSYLEFAQFGALEAIGQFEAMLGSGTPRRAKLADGVEYLLLPSAKDSLTKISALAEAHIAPCDTVSDNPTDSSDGTREPFVLNIQTDGSGDLLFQHSMTFTNIDIVLLPDTLDYCSRIGRAELLVDPEASLGGPRFDSPEGLDYAVQKIGRIHDLRQDDAVNTYLAMRARFEAALIRIPLLGIEARYGAALLVTATLSVGLAAWTSLLFRRLASLPNLPGEEEPTPILEPFLEPRRTRGLWPLAILELLVVEIFVAAFLIAPLVAVAALLDPLAYIHGRVQWTLMAIAAALATIFTASICTNYARLIIRAVGHAHRPSQ